MDSGKIRYDLYMYRKEWLKKRIAWLIILAAVWCGLFAATYFCDFLGEWKAFCGGAMLLIGICTYGYINNKMSAYAEDKVFGETKDKE